MVSELYIAVDLGAGSGRVFLGGVEPNDLLLEEISRFQYPPLVEENHLRWNLHQIFAAIKEGLKRAGERAKQLNRSIYGIGVDSWAVDYGLLDENGKLMGNPICYRDSRTNNLESAFRRISRERIFEITGIQFLSFNTIYQLFADEKASRASKILLLPDLINFFLTGKQFAEYTNATTTQLVNAKTGNWEPELFSVPHLPFELMPEIIPAGKDLGFLKPEIAEELNLENVRVIAPATHDTGSAVAGAPLEKDQAYISSGTWSLVGVELDEPLINDQVAEFNFTNEGGAFGTIRFLKNVMGLWVFESCRKEWKAQELATDYETLLREVSEIKDFQGFIFPDDERFLNPPSMLNAIKEQLEETGQDFSDDPSVITKIILDSLAFRYASVLQTIESLTGQKLKGLQIVGGGGRNEYLNRMTANASGLRVKFGLTEATVTGNILVQAISAGRFKNLSEARNYVAENIELKEVTPQFLPDFIEAQEKYKAIENYILNKS